MTSPWRTLWIQSVAETSNASLLRSCAEASPSGPYSSQCTRSFFFLLFLLFTVLFLTHLLIHFMDSFLSDVFLTRFFHLLILRDRQFSLQHGPKINSILSINVHTSSLNIQFCQEYCTTLCCCCYSPDVMCFPEQHVQMHLSKYSHWAASQPCKNSCSSFSSAS